MPDFSILMPTYNDAATIQESIESILNQSLDCWQLIIIDDGSTDSTPVLLSRLKDERIKIIRQENAGQLNALRNGSKHIKGRYVLLMHSDDTFCSCFSLEEIKKMIQRTENREQRTENREVDGFFADIATMDEQNKDTGIITVYDPERAACALLYHRGSNMLGDFFLVKKGIFQKYIIKNYINDNVPYFYDFSQNTRLLNLKRIQPWYRYRIFSENYMNSDIGKYVALSGKLRTTSRMLRASLSFNLFFYYASRVINKFFRSSPSYLPAIKKRKNPSILFALLYYSEWARILTKEGYPNLAIVHLEAIKKTLQLRLRKSDKALQFKKPAFSYKGSDARLFYRRYSQSGESDIYRELLTGNYSRIVCRQEEKEDVAQILDFMCLFVSVEISDVTYK